ncbi:MAG: hypothetical protein A2653_01495 [Candidatus Zambryskibacteria bacterium RIFCSPHIGHO2_01_FULL_43_25]|uniref:Uncharacterized protein n=1 Tax=Candidatus Zambryskibacteria bacterium RIFCSPLOWO2_01_FULL_45_21 TaxID=1802761 RepID=A0A1G2U3R9_9BACT|nr:MAG: hypothetical protein A2653_01495 [Candidatus Zambryskibacteria bacterium RIFCSPHIGHO2_01_FULL_43_25]OHB00372.1 MAG: hypothetical protein A3E94_01545 [Candidatus Zambryskibacteria bacterium RIFCSPHIGHO2_12_FULL_44_12b]OHB04167.1 MAG: hypothetical protein A3B14_02015 [Candidatus Zambryskibacteria bacterium RIFCSPLOWO2_01_FULL_45_21]
MSFLGFRPTALFTGDTGRGVEIPILTTRTSHFRPPLVDLWPVVGTISRKKINTDTVLKAKFKQKEPNKNRPALTS